MCIIAYCPIFARYLRSAAKQDVRPSQGVGHPSVPYEHLRHPFSAPERWCDRGTLGDHVFDPADTQRCERLLDEPRIFRVQEFTRRHIGELQLPGCLRGALVATSRRTSFGMRSPKSAAGPALSPATTRNPRRDLMLDKSRDREPELQAPGGRILPQCRLADPGISTLARALVSGRHTPGRGPVVRRRPR
jgi:hypothetical protein